MYSRALLAPIADKPIDRTAASNVPHRLLVLLASNPSAIQSQTLIEAAKATIIGASTDVSRTEVLNVTAGEATDNASTKVTAATAATFVHKDTTVRSIFEALLESDPVATLETLLNTSEGEENSLLKPIIRYAYQVVLPGALSVEKHSIKVNVMHRERQANKFRRTENGMTVDDEILPVLPPTASAPAVNAKVSVPLQDCIFRPSHPAFLLYHSIASWDEAKTIADKSCPTRRARAIVDALSICASANHYSQPRRDFVDAAKSALKVAVEGPAKVEDGNQSVAASIGADSKDPEGPSIYAESKGSDAKHVPLEVLPLADYLSRLDVTTARCLAIQAVFDDAVTAARALLTQINNTVQISHVFPSVDRGASSSAILKFELCPEPHKGGSYNLPKAAVNEDAIATSVAQLCAGYCVSLAALRPTNNSAFLTLSDLMNPKGFDFRYGDALLITPGSK